MYRNLARNKGGSNYPPIITLDISEVRTSNELIIGENPEKVIYANLQNEKCCQYIQSLLVDNIDFILRPTGLINEFGTNLRGFGIEMRPFKYSMDYGVKDSATISTNSSILLKTDPTISLTQQPNDQINEIKKFDLKLASYLKNQSKMKAIRDIISNFPVYLPEIAKANITSEATRAVNHISFLQKQVSNFQTLNGRLLPQEGLDIFNLIDAIKQEKTVRQILRSVFKVESSFIDSICSSGVKSDSSSLIDTRSEFVIYLNDLETDVAYSSFSNDINELYNPRYRIPQLKKNLVHLILFADPSSIHGSIEIDTMNYLVRETYPVRIGLIPTFNLGNSLSRQVAFAYAHLRRFSHEKARDFILSSGFARGYNENSHQPNPINEYQFQASYIYCSQGFSVLDWDDIYKLYNEETEEFQFLANLTSYGKKLGIRVNTILVNGKRATLQEGLPSLMNEIFLAFQAIVKACKKEKKQNLNDIDSFELLSNYHFVLPGLNYRVVQEAPKSLNLINENLAIQEEFTQFIQDIQWNSSDDGFTISYFILFFDENSEVNLSNFLSFMKENHLISTNFAINPLVPNHLKNILLPKTGTRLIVNGRVFDDFDVTDIESLRLLDAWSKFIVFDVFSDIINKLKYKKSLAAAYISAIAFDWKVNRIRRKVIYDEIFENLSLIYVSKNPTDLKLRVIVDPVSYNFQRRVAIYEYVDRIGLVNLNLALIPPKDLSQSTTISSYFRHSIESDDAYFTFLNYTTTYSSMPDWPHTWVVESMKASIDLDNILLSELSPSEHEGIYLLTNILIEGSALTPSGEPAGGTELALFDSERRCDTLAMMLTGYWQLPAFPGEFIIKLGGSRSKRIYFDSEFPIIVSSFVSTNIPLVFRHIPGMEHMQVYNISSKSNLNSTRVDVFAVASGHLYERLLKIMMVSTRRNTNYQTTFWLLKNFLSPQFKASLPTLSKEYNFSYQLVFYKWPRWVYPQFEKQRIIWGNKILFLDVLFPLDLDRVIYVDADQIVRTDLIELMRMDFEGAPYAFTPMCDTRVEIEPYRFWKTGYWKDHLRDKKYHISALFAIDLGKFREMAAGDWLRFYYGQLSNDPNSLANLDQDLPNYAQYHIPIFSLPQNWLWCETWCSDETMDEAKTIDLCNNPLTKIPKLEIAQTRVKEWPGLDQEVGKFHSGVDDYLKTIFTE